MEKTDILIIGGGPAGFTLHLYPAGFPILYQLLKNLRIIFWVINRFLTMI